MKKTLLMLAGILLLSCQSNTADKSEKKSTSKNLYSFDFLLGDWKRTNEEKGKTTYESWKKHNDSTYIGKSYTMLGKDTVFCEKAILSPINSKWVYQVKTNDDPETTNFELMEYGPESFICENLNNSFPTLIKYERTNDILEAEISNEETSIPFYFTSL